MRVIFMVSCVILCTSLLKANINEVLSWRKQVQEEGAEITQIFYQYPIDSGVEKIGFFTKKFKWNSLWGNPNDKYVFIDGKEYNKKDFYKKLYKMFRDYYGSLGCPRIYWPKFYPKPEWKQQFAFRDKSMTKFEYNKQKWEKMHFRPRTNYQIGKLQAKFIEKYNRKANDEDYEEDELMDIDFINNLLQGYSPDIFQHNTAINGAKKWIKVKKRYEDDTFLAKRVAIIFQKFGDALIPSKMEQEQQKKIDNRNFEKDLQEWRDSLPSNPINNIEKIKRKFAPYDNHKHFIEGCSKAKKLLEEKKTLTDKDKKALKEINKILKLDKDTDNGNLKKNHPTTLADIAEYCLLKNMLIGEGCEDAKKLKIEQYIKDREKKFPNIEKKVTQVDLQLVNKSVDWKNYSTHRFSIIIKDPATSSILDKAMFHVGNGNIIFFTFAVASITIKIEPLQNFPFKGQGTWDLLNAKYPITLDLKKIKMMQ